MMKVMRATEVLIFMRVRAAPPIRCINRWPAVILAVSRTAKATG